MTPESTSKYWSYVSEASPDIETVMLLIIISALTILAFVYLTQESRVPWEHYGFKRATITLNITETIEHQMAHGTDSFVGWLGSMTIITRDVNLIKSILVKSFNVFPNRTPFTQTRSLLGRGLFFLKGWEWKRMRHIMSPSFSTNKLKMMSSSIDTSARKLAETLEACAREDRLLELKHTLGQFTTGIIAKTGFGLATDCLGEVDNEFTRYCKTLFKKRGAVGRTVEMFLLKFPNLHTFIIKTLKIGHLDPINPGADLYFNTILQRAVKEREEKWDAMSKKPSDLLQSLLSMKADKNVPAASNSITENDVIAQSLLIMFAAFETTSTALQMCLALLAIHPDIQEKVHHELETVVPATKDDPSPTPSHEQLRQLSFMQQVLDETLRLYPPGGFLSRMTNETVTFEVDEDPRSNQFHGADDVPPNSRKIFTIPSGTSILIPIWKIHRDPRHYKNPDVFDPGHFTPEAIAARHPSAFLPFGLGPRQCIGMRLAYKEMKTALVHVLRRVRVEVNETTEPQAGQGPAVRFSGILAVKKVMKLAVKLR